jgi:uncharacterized protein
MQNKITNPFITGGYIKPAYFCDRQNETDKLLKAISSRRNITLISLRRMGKTGLMKHVRYLLEHSEHPYAVVYVDLLPTMNGNEMLNSLSSALIRLKKEEKGFFERILTVLGSLRPKLTYDSLTGQPSIELKIESSSDFQSGLDHLLSFISEIKQDLVFMFDEFQQISNYPEKNTEHLLRTILQSFPTIPCVFSGSSKHMLEKMFVSAGSPFFQSAELMYLDKINKDEYSNFIIGQLLKDGKKISKDVLTRISDWTRLHTYYVQYICNLLFEKDKKIIDNDLVSQVFHEVLTAFEPLFLSYRNLIPPHQFKLLQAIAAEDGITQPTSGKFIVKHNLTSASSVSTSLKALEEKEMIVYDRDLWLVYDVFFSRWLEYNYK